MSNHYQRLYINPPLSRTPQHGTDKEWEDEEMKEDSSTQASVKKKHLIPWVSGVYTLYVYSNHDH